MFTGGRTTSFGRSSCCVLLLLSLLQLLAVVSGFQKIVHSNGPLRSQNSIPLSTAGGMAITTRSSSNGRSLVVRMMDTIPTREEEEELAFVADFKMITEGEAQFRKMGGIFFGVATIVAFFVQEQLDYRYGILTAGVFLALAMYRTGAEYQCGCIANNLWNIGSPFSFQRVPDQYQDFVKEKQRQLLNNVVTSAAFGIVLSNVVSLATGDASTHVLLETTQASLPIFLLGGAATALTTLFQNKE